MSEAKPKTTRRQRIPQPPKSTHSMRVYDHVWDSARRRATHEGYNMNQLLATILQGYAEGKLNMPKQVF